MSVCVRCGHALGVGRFCLNCGHPVDASAPAPQDGPPTWRSDTAERPAVPAEPEPAHYPLHVDEAGPTATGTHRAVTTRRPLWPWFVAGTVALLLVAALGATLLLQGDEGPGTAADPAASTTPSPAPTDEPTTPEPSPSPSDSPTETSDGEPEAPADVARQADVAVPATAPPNEDTEGNLVRYEGRNMLDGVPETTWRMPGDGSGETIVLTLAEPTTVSSLGLVNGYAKTSGTFDWYAGNRRVLSVVWELDDGTTISQDLTESRDLQSVDVPDVETQTVRLTLVEVSEPGSGPSRRDYTAVSEVSVVGLPAG